MTNEINKILLAKTEDFCAFCEQSEKDVELLFIGTRGKGICNSCVSYVRETMGLTPKLTIDMVLAND